MSYLIAVISSLLLGWLLGRRNMANIIIDYLRDKEKTLGTGSVDRSVNEILFTVREHVKRVAYLRRNL